MLPLSYAAIANLVVIDAFSASDNAIYCIVTPCECRIAMEMEAICTPHRTAAVAKPRRRLCIVALHHPSIGAYTLSILPIKAPVIGTRFLLPRRTSIGLFTVILSFNLSLNFTTIRSQRTRDMCLCPGPAMTSCANRWR